MNEYLILHVENDSRNSFVWSSNTTKMLLDCYKKYREDVGTLKIRNLKRLWEIISLELKSNFNVNVTAANCENRWRVLERNFKKYVDASNKTGSGRRQFGYADEMNEILGKKKNVCPEILLSSTSVSYSNSSTVKENSEPCENSRENLENSETVNTNSTQKAQCKVMKSRITGKKLKNSDTLERIRLDRQKYHEQRLNFEREKYEKCLKLETEKLEIEKKRNELLEENNKIVQERNNLLKQLLETDGNILGSQHSV